MLPFVGARMQSPGMCKEVAGVEQRASRGTYNGAYKDINIVQCYNLGIRALKGGDTSVCLLMMPVVGFAVQLFTPP